MSGRRPKWKIPSKETLLSVIVKGKYFSWMTTPCTPRSNIITRILEDLDLPTSMSQRMWVYNTLRKDVSFRERVKTISGSASTNHSTASSENEKETFIQEDGKLLSSDLKLCMNFNIILSSEEWEKIKPVKTEKGFLRMTDWTALFAKKLRDNSLIAKCTINGVYHRIRRIYIPEEKTCRAGVIQGLMKCSNGDCPIQIRFASTSIDAHRGTKFRIEVTGLPNHEDMKPRQLRGADRIQEGSINISTASERRAQLLAKLGEYSTVVPSASAISKARSEMRTLNRGDNNYIHQLLALHSTLRPTYIRSIEIIPFRLLLWSEKMIECYQQQVSLVGRVALLFDATGGKINKVNNKQVLISSLVLPAITKGQPQIAVGMMLSNSNNTSAYTNFFQRWLHFVESRRIKQRPAAIIIDKNWPSIHAICLAFNQMDIMTYLRTSMQIIEGQSNVDLNTFTVIGIGRSHTVRNIVHFESLKCRRDPSTKLWWKYASINLLTMTDWVTIKRYLKSLFRVLLADVTSDIMDDIDYIKSVILRFDFEFESDDEDIFKICEHNNEMNKSTALYKQSPFFVFGKKLLDDVQINMKTPSTQCIISSNGNVKQNPELAFEILKFVVAYAPMVTGIMFNINRYSEKQYDFQNTDGEMFSGWRESFVEGWHNILKNHVLKGYQVISPQEFITLTEASMRGRCIDFISHMKQTMPSDEANFQFPLASAYEDVHSLESDDEVTNAPPITSRVFQQQSSKKFEGDNTRYDSSTILQTAFKQQSSLQMLEEKDSANTPIPKSAMETQGKHAPLLIEVNCKNTSTSTAPRREFSLIRPKDNISRSASLTRSITPLKQCNSSSTCSMAFDLNEFPIKNSVSVQSQFITDAINDVSDKENYETIQSHRNFFTDAETWLKKAAISVTQVHNSKDDLPISKTELVQDRFKKRRKRKSLYIQPVSIHPQVIPGLALPTGGNISLIIENRRVQLHAISTCCLDTLLMTASYAYSKFPEFAEEAKCPTVNEDDKLFTECISAISVAKASNDLEVARAKLLMKAEIFRTNKVSQPLSANACKTKYTVSLDTSETILAEHFLLRYNRFSRLSVCTNAECEDRTVNLKFILIQENSIKRTCELLEEANIIQVCNKRYRKSEQIFYCNGTRKETPVTSAQPPSIIVFVVPEPTDVMDTVRPSHEDVVSLFGNHYGIFSVHFFKRPSSLYASGHYTSCMKTANAWTYYDGLKKKLKPPCLLRWSTYSKNKVAKLDLFPSLMFYGLLS